MDYSVLRELRKVSYKGQTCSIVGRRAEERIISWKGGRRFLSRASP